MNVNSAVKWDKIISYFVMSQGTGYGTGTPHSAGSLRHWVRPFFCYVPGQERYNREYEHREVNYQVMLISFEDCLSLLQKIPHYLPSTVHSNSWFVFVLFPVFGRCSSRLRDDDFQRHSNVSAKATFSLGKRARFHIYVFILFIILCGQKIESWNQ